MAEVCYQPSSASKRSLSVCACTFPCSSPPKTFPSRLFVDLPDVWTAPESPRLQTRLLGSPRCRTPACDLWEK